MDEIGVLGWIVIIVLAIAISVALVGLAFYWLWNDFVTVHVAGTTHVSYLASLGPAVLVGCITGAWRGAGRSR